MAAASPSPSEQAARVFALYGLEPSFEIDISDLEDRLRQASLAWHPDRFALQGEEARLEAEDKMAEFNDGFPLLAKPAKRAELLLNWLGAPPTQGTDAEAGPEQATVVRGVDHVPSHWHCTDKHDAQSDPYHPIVSAKQGSRNRKLHRSMAALAQV